MPHRSSVPMSWRLRKSRYKIHGTSCKCGKLHMPPKNVCPCGNENLEGFEFSGNGSIISHTEVHIAPAGHERITPYNIALIRLDEGPVISGVVVDKDLAIGEKVRSVFRRIAADNENGLINYGFKFELVE